MWRRIASLGQSKADSKNEPMPQSPGDVASSPDSTRPGGFANVFKGLTGGKLTKSPPPNLQAASSTAISPMPDQMSAALTTGNALLSQTHKEALRHLREGTPSERIAAAQTLRHAVAEYPLSPVLDIWQAAKDLIEPDQSVSARETGWGLLTECVRHKSSTDLERREFFETLTAQAHNDDFHLQLAALVDLTNHGREVSGFDYEIIPLLRKWLRRTYLSVKSARQQASRDQKKNNKVRVPIVGGQKNLQQLLAFIIEVIKFSSNIASEEAISGLVDELIAICESTTSEQDLRTSLDVIDAIFTFASMPASNFRKCISTVGSIFCFVGALNKPAWHTMSMILISHNGHATVNVLLDTLRTPWTESTLTDKRKADGEFREVRGALSVLEKLLTKTTEKGYPTIPFALLMDGLEATAHKSILVEELKATLDPYLYRNAMRNTCRMQVAVLRLINSLFTDETGSLHPIILEEDWSTVLSVAVDCSDKVLAPALAEGGSTSSDNETNKALSESIPRELKRLFARLEDLVAETTRGSVSRQAVVRFFTDTHALLPDTAANIVLVYFQDFRCCSPSDAQWKQNLALVRREFFANRNRATQTRLLALRSITDAYEMMDLIQDQMEDDSVSNLVKDTLTDVSDETDLVVLGSLVSFAADVAVSADMKLFNSIISTLKGIISNDRRKSTDAALAPSSTQDQSAVEADESVSGVVTSGFVKLFIRCMHSDGQKALRLFDCLVQIAKSSHCKDDARLVAMKLLFRLRADWASNIFLIMDTESVELAASLYRTDASLAKKVAADAAQQSRPQGLARNRGVSFSHGSGPDRSLPMRSVSGPNTTVSRSKQLWSLPDRAALPEEPSPIASSVLASFSEPEPETEPDLEATSEDSVSEDQDDPASGAPIQREPLNIAAWLDAIVQLLETGCDWEVYSMILVHLPAQLSNHALFRGAIPQMQSLRRLLCEQIRLNSFQEPPSSDGLRRADVAICLYHSMTMILSYHEHFLKDQEDEIVRAFVNGISTWERCAKYCIHALTICCHELPLSTSKSLVQMLQKMATIITQPHVAMHILEFLAGLSRLQSLYVNFREDEYRIVFGICIRYLQYVRDKRQSQRPADSESPSSDDLPQYVHALAHHVITFWFLALKLPDRSNHVGWIAKNLFSDIDGANNSEEQALVTIDFMQRVAYADANESVHDLLFTKERFGEISKRRWVVGNSIISIEQAASTGWAQITKRQPSGTSTYLVKENFRPPPSHQSQHASEANREADNGNQVLPSHLMVQLMTTIPQTFEALRPIPLPSDESIDRAIRVFDRNSTVDGHKVGIIYIGEDQTSEAEILANVSGSSDYVDFLNGLGTLTKLKGSTFNTQGLDRENDIDGQYTFCWRDRVTEMVFHVITQMPTNLERDPQSTLKKRHIGNDFVNIVFNDSGHPFKFDTFPSEFNYVYIVITPESRASFIANREAPPADKQSFMPFYKVQLLSKPGFPTISSASETKMVSLKALPGFVRLLALNASVFSHVWVNRDGGDTVSSWRNRLREIRRLRDKHGPKLSTSNSSHQLGLSAGNAGTSTPSPPPTSFGGAHHGSSLAAASHSQATDFGRTGGSTVRDSFGSSLRRSSVATFFTNTSEQNSHSHRSSVMSTSTNTNETEVADGNVLESLVESVDFSKWA